MTRGRPRNFGAQDHLSLSPPLKVPDVDFGGTFGVVKKPPPTAISKKRRKRLKKLEDENPELADW
jgi:hypothetical protein